METKFRIHLKQHRHILRAINFIQFWRDIIIITMIIIQNELSTLSFWYNFEVFWWRTCVALKQNECKFDWCFPIIHMCKQYAPIYTSGIKQTLLENKNKTISHWFYICMFYWYWFIRYISYHREIIRNLIISSDDILYIHIALHFGTNAEKNSKYTYNMFNFIIIYLAYFTDKKCFVPIIIIRWTNCVCWWPLFAVLVTYFIIIIIDKRHDITLWFREVPCFVSTSSYRFKQDDV